MNKKYTPIIFLMSALLFILGIVMVNQNTGMLGVIGFVGYVLLSLAVFVVICTFAVNLVLRRELKSNGKKE